MGEQRSKKVRAGDKVLVIAGNCRGQTGKVLRCQGEKVLVQGINLRKKHVKPTQQNPKGNVMEMEKPIHISNVCVCDDENNRLKLKVQTENNGTKVLVNTKDGNKTYRTLKK